MLASVGLREVVAVRRRPRVGVLSTGDELVDDGPARCSPARSATPTGRCCSPLVAESGFEAVDLGLVARRRGRHRRRHRATAPPTCDAVVTSGGVCMGDFDFVKVVLDRIGDMRWMQVAIKPAKPLAFGVVGDGDRSRCSGCPATRCRRW